MYQRIVARLGASPGIRPLDVLISVNETATEKLVVRKRGGPVPRPLRCAGASARWVDSAILTGGQVSA